jgi:hypothetical protein
VHVQRVWGSGGVLKGSVFKEIEGMPKGVGECKKLDGRCNLPLNGRLIVHEKSLHDAEPFL